MEFLSGSERLLGGWLLPAGAALVALGVTAIGGALWQFARARRQTRKTAVQAPVVDLHDGGPENPANSDNHPPARRLDSGELVSLDREIARLERELEYFESLTEGRPQAAVASPGKVLRYVREDSPPETAETRALSAFVARGQ